MGLDSGVTIAVLTQGTDACHARNGPIDGDGNVFEGQRRERMTQSGQHLMLETFHVDFAELWLAVPRDELIESHQRHADHRVPLDPLESSVDPHVVHPGVGKG